MSTFSFNPRNPRPVIIAGPCMAENKDLLFEIATEIKNLSHRLEFDYVFKASFDKANRTSINSFRGPGLDKVLEWFTDLKSKLQIPILTDIHESCQVEQVASVVDVLQIPAFLCRQTDLIVAAVQSGKAVNIKKGQFLAPDASKHIASKVSEAANEKKISVNFAVTERGTCFGYKDLIVDLRSFPVLKKSCPQAAIIFDITHSVQQPAAGGQQGEISGGLRAFAPSLARGVAASGYVDGFFLEVHTNPSKALSDAAVQLSIEQAKQLLTQTIDLWKHSKAFNEIDANFIS